MTCFRCIEAYSEAYSEANSEANGEANSDIVFPTRGGDWQQKQRHSCVSGHHSTTAEWGQNSLERIKKPISPEPGEPGAV